MQMKLSLILPKRILIKKGKCFKWEVHFSQFMKVTSNEGNVCYSVNDVK